MRLRRVVVGTDFSESSVAATRWAAGHFLGDAETILAHVIAIPEPPGFLRGRYPQIETVAATARIGAEAKLAELGATLGGRACRFEVRVGDPAAQLADIARVTAADLVIVGRHGNRRGTWGHLGTTADHLVRITPIPILIAARLRDVRPRRILLALDGADVSAEVGRWGVGLASRFGATLRAIHVVSSSVLVHVLTARAGRTSDIASRAALTWEDAREHLDGESVRWVQSLVERGTDAGEMLTEVTFGEPGQEIVAAAERHASELIVMGRRSGGAVRHFFLGSVIREVLHTARCPVLVVVEPEDAIASSIA